MRRSIDFMKKDLSDTQKTNIMLGIMQEAKHVYQVNTEKREKAEVETIEADFKNL